MKQENKTIITYKGFDKDLKCRGFQYEVGKEYELPKGETVEICRRGFHACESPLEVLDYYFMDGHANLSRFCEVEQSGEFSKEVDSTKVASSKIKIKKEITFADLIELGVEWLKEKTSNDRGGDSAKIASSGNNSQIGSLGDFAQICSSGNCAQICSSGDSSKIGSSGGSAQIGSSGYSSKIGSSGSFAQIGSSGGCAQIASSGYSTQIGSSGGCAQIVSSGDTAKIGSLGNSAKIASSSDRTQIGSLGNYAQIALSGDYAQITSSGYSAQIALSGDYAQINSTGENSVIMCAGRDSAVKAKKGSWITLAEWYIDEETKQMKPKYVKAEYVDGERIKEDTWYKLVDGEFIEA